MKLLLAVLASASLMMSVQAAEMEPEQLIKSVTEDVLVIVRADKDIQSGNTKKAVALVETKVLPHFNFVRMTQLALGREWKNASTAQQTALTDEFRTLLVRTYSKALTEYRSQTIEYKPATTKPGDTETKVKTQVNQSSGKPIPLDYSLEKLSNGWKVYDIEVAGVSLVINYRETFSNEVRNGGIDGLIKALQTKNGSADKK